MRLFNWAETFRDTRTLEDIPALVQKLETQYWLWMAFSILVFLFGFAILVFAPSGDIKSQLIGLFIAVDGGFYWAVIKIWVHIRLATYRVIWDSQNRAAEEMRKLEAADL
jgi:hypothetical protein